MASGIKNQAVKLLRWSERFTKTDMVYLAHGGIWVTSGTFFSYILAFVTVLAFANLLPVELYGTYQYILAIVDLCGIFVLGGIDTAITRSTARGQEGSIVEALRTKVRWGLIGGVISATIGAYYLIQGNSVLGLGFLIAAIAIPLWEAPGLYLTYLQGKKRFDLLTLSELGVQLLATLIIVPLLFVTDNLLLILAGYFASYGIGRAFCLRWTMLHLPPNKERDPEMIPYGKHLTIMQGINTLAASADKILLWHFLGAAPVAIYTFAQAIPLRAIGALKMVNRLAFPKMATQENEILQQTLMRKVMLLVFTGTLGAITYALVAPLFFALFFPSYLNAVPYTQLAAALIALQPFSLIGSSLTAQAKQKSLYIVNTFSPLARLALFILLIPFFGLWGAVIGLVGAKIIESSILVFLFYR